MVPLGTAQLRRYLVLAWRVLALHALESPTLPPCAQSTPGALILAVTQPLHSRYAGVGLARPVKAACQAGDLGLVRAFVCIKRPPRRDFSTIATLDT